MRIHAGLNDAKRRAPGARMVAVACVTGAIWLAGCASSQPPLELADSHPASPRAATAATTASTALVAYRAPQDFARRADAAPAAGAEGHGAAHAGGATVVAQADAARPSGVGTVNAVNRERRTVNLSHEPIPSVGWPAMTMDLPVTSAVDLSTIRPGSRVTFTLRRGADGLYAIDSVTPAPASSPSQPKGSGMPGMGGMDHGSMGSGGTPRQPGGSR